MQINSQTLSQPQFGGIRLEYQNKDLKPLELRETPSPSPEWTQHTLMDDQVTVGTVRQLKNSETDVRFFKGKGGFAAIVTSHDLRFLALPGSRIELPDTVLDLPGEPIELSPGKTPCQSVYDQNFQPQQVTNQAMILGAGLATRFEPISGNTTGFSKPGVPLVGEDSVIVGIARHMKKHGFNRILVNTYYMPEQIKQQLTAQVDGVEFVFIDEEKPSGTAGGLARAFKEGKVDREKPILIMQGDAVTDADLSLLVNTHAAKEARATLGVQPVPDEDVSKVAIIKTDRASEDGESGRIQSYVEKPSLEEAGDSRLGSIGFYVLSPEVYESFERMGAEKASKDEEFDYAKNFFPAMLEKSGERTNMWAQKLEGYWSDVGNSRQYIQTVKDIFAGRVNVPLPANVREFFENGVIYWPGTRAKADANGAKLEGNVIVAKTPEGIQA